MLSLLPMLSLPRIDSSDSTGTPELHPIKAIAQAPMVRRAAGTIASNFARARSPTNPNDRFMHRFLSKNGRLKVSRPSRTPCEARGGSDCRLHATRFGRRSLRVTRSYEDRLAPLFLRPRQ